VLFFIAAGATYVKPENWSPFTPYGWSGVTAAAAVVFFAYIGFDAVSTTAEEAKNPRRDLPIGIIASLIICTALYLIVAAILSGIVPVVQYKTNQQFLNAPVAFALTIIGQDWAAYLVSAGAVAGITSVLLVMLMSQPRIFFAMSRDGLLPQGVSKVHHDHHLRDRRHRRRTDADPGGWRDDEHRHAVRVRRRVRGGDHPAAPAA
jgi:APA family basic amino acid/polyamine antiporter